MYFLKINRLKFFLFDLKNDYALNNWNSFQDNSCRQ